jgi:hypothetical protein
MANLSVFVISIQQIAIYKKFKTMQVPKNDNSGYNGESGGISPKV